MSRARPARTSLNPRERTSSRRSRGLSDDLASRGAFPRAPSDRRGARHGRRPADGAPSPKASRRRRLSKSATKARIEPERRKRIVDIPRFCVRQILARSAFVADLDTLPPRPAPGAPPAPSCAHPSCTAAPIPTHESPFPVREGLNGSEVVPQYRPGENRRELEMRAGTSGRRATREGRPGAVGPARSFYTTV